MISTYKAYLLYDTLNRTYLVPLDVYLLYDDAEMKCELDRIVSANSQRWKSA